MSTKRVIMVLVALSLMVSGMFCVAVADHGEHKEKRWYQKIFDSDDDNDNDDDDHHTDNGRGSKHFRNRYLNPVSNPTYREQCEACHFAYQPELLPSVSWGKIIALLPDHFGGTVAVDHESRKIIAEYLEANSAEHSSAKLAVKIMRSLKKQTPMRITDVPYIRHEHEDDDIPPDALQRKSVGSMSNCVACHTTAENGIYDDDHVVIPR